MSSAQDEVHLASFPRELRGALGTSPVNWPMLLMPMPWLVLSDSFYVAQHGLGWRTLPVVLIAQAGQVLFCFLVLKPALRLLPKPSLRKSLAVLTGFAGAAVVRSWLLTALTPGQMLPRLVWLLPAELVSTVIWLSLAAVFSHWWHNTRIERLALTTEYERLVRTRASAATALAETSQELAEVKAGTHQAVAEIRERLDPAMSLIDLVGTVALIDRVLSGQVRPASHELAQMPAVLQAPDVEPLWLDWRELVPGLLRRWPVARPFAPVAVAVICLPMVVAAEFVPAPHRIDTGSLMWLPALGFQLGLLWLARAILERRLRQMQPRAAVAVTFATYLVMYLVGLAALLQAALAGVWIPLEAVLMPPLLAGTLGGVEAGARTSADERATARRLIARTTWDLRRTRQQLWALRRRLALALHGRVQANLTAAGLVLGMAVQEFEREGTVDAAEIQRVRESLDLADRIDVTPSAPAVDRLGQVAKVWVGIMQVDLDLRPVGVALLASSEDVADACVEVLREILLNAVRHGEATSALASVGAVGDSLLGIRVKERSPGRAPAAVSDGSGVGRSLMSSLAMDWAERDDPDGRTTVALLAAGTSAPRTARAEALLADGSLLG